MSDVTTDQSETQKHQGTQYERRDVDFVGVLATAAMLAVVVALSCAACWWLFATPPHAIPSAVPNRRQARLPPEPRLEQIDRMEAAQSQDLTAQSHAPHLRADQQLNSYAWVDREARIVRIPIRQAMKIVVESNLLPAVSDGMQESRESKDSAERGAKK